MKTLYAAYGSNLNKAQMAYRCPNAKPVGVTHLNDYRLVFQGSPYGAHANVIPAKGCTVPAVVWKITAEDEKHLDIYEGVKGGYYTKEYMEVEVNGETCKALIYIMTPNPYGIPAAFYLDTIERGYADFNLPTSVLDAAVRYTCKHIKTRRKTEEETA